MSYLILGLALFTGPHLIFPSWVALRSSLINRLGENGYKGVFSLLAISGIVLMVVGYSRMAFLQVYTPPQWGRHVTLILMAVSLILFAAANMPGNIKRVTRHPMMWGLVLWAVGHLLANGDKASLLLFGGLGVYGLLAMMSANLRGAQKQTYSVPVKKDVIIIAAGLVVYVVLVIVHPYLFGVAVYT